MIVAPQCLLVVAAIAAVATSAPVTQEEYARYIAQQQTQRLEEKPEKALSPAAAPRRPPPVQLVSVGAYQQPTAARPPAYQLAAAAYQPQTATYQSALAAYQQQQPGDYQPQPASSYAQPQPASSYAQPSGYRSPQAAAYQQPEEYQQPEQQYQPAAAVRVPAPRPKAAARPKAVPNRPEKPEDEENDNNPNAQYQFSFDISDDESTNYHNRKEQRDGEKISGSYSVVDSDGFIRTVTYTADPEEGFKAEVSREPTNIQVKIPTPAPQTAAPAVQYRLPERKAAQPQYITVQANEPEAAEQPAEPISGYYRQASQPAKSSAAHRFAAPVSQQAGSGKASSAFGYATGPTSPPIIYQAYQQQ